MTKLNILQAIKYLGNSGDSFLDIENYEKYRFSPEKIDCHHRREITEGKTREQLIEEGLYYGVPASDLIFLTHREHMTLHKSGKNHHLFGKKHSEETKKKMSQSLTGENHPSFGKHRSEVTRQKMSESHKGEKNPNFGKHLSEETKKKISESNRRKADLKKILTSGKTTGQILAMLIDVCRARGIDVDKEYEI